MAVEEKVRIAAVSDIHYHRHAKDHMKEVFEAASAKADVLLLCGDMTDYGLPEEAQVLVQDLRSYVRIPVIGVLGNHDFESGHVDEVVAILEENGVEILDGSTIEVKGVGFAGVCGFGGGFGRFMLNAWGEPLIKQFVQASVDEALKLEQALSMLQTEQRIVVMHYAPICETVQGEPPEIFPFLGSSRLEEPINRFTPAAVFHGHAHKGAPEARTSAGVPVYNVAVQVLRALHPDRPPVRFIEVEPVSAPAEEAAS